MRSCRELKPCRIAAQCCPFPCHNPAPPCNHTEIDKLLRGPGLQYQFNVDVTSFSASDRTRLTLNYNGHKAPEEEAGELQLMHAWPLHVISRAGAPCVSRSVPRCPSAKFNRSLCHAAPEMADADTVWRRFKEGCSVRVLHPQVRFGWLA